MNEAAAHRLAAMTGLAIAAAIAVWWLGSTRLALDHGTDAGRSAADALSALLLVRGMVLAILSARVGALRGWNPAVMAALGLIAPSWPLVALAWSASSASLTHVLLAEVLLLAGGAALPLIGVGLRHSLRQAELAVVTATGVGTALAASLWITRGFWATPLR